MSKDLQLGTNMSDCPRAWQNFIESLNMRDDVQAMTDKEYDLCHDGSGWKPEALDKFLAQYGGEWIPLEPPLIRFETTAGYMMFMLSY